MINSIYDPFFRRLLHLPLFPFPLPKFFSQ
nr:MAG TPA: hypothetical protein [Caudoviricetes sp.]